MRLFVITMLWTSSFAFCADDSPQFSKSTEKVADEAPLNFEVEKSAFSDATGSLKIWGKIKNSSKTTYDQLQVILVAKDKDGKFLGRNTWYFEPQKVKPEQVAYIESKFIETENRKPAKVEWLIVGTEIASNAEAPKSAAPPMHQMEVTLAMMTLAHNDVVGADDELSTFIEVEKWTDSAKKLDELLASVLLYRKQFDSLSAEEKKAKTKEFKANCQHASLTMKLIGDANGVDKETKEAELKRKLTTRLLTYLEFKVQFFQQPDTAQYHSAMQTADDIVEKYRNK